MSTVISASSCDVEKNGTDGGKEYTYESVEGDPFNLRVYTLDNGLKVFISENHAEPRIQTNIAVRTGSKQDPEDATGLAHYLEHMLFKGTSKFGTIDWETEKQYLDLISGYYEELRNTEDEDARQAILEKIDSVSQVAAQFVAANEYDKLISGLGAKGTNAYTSYERTVYINDIPSTELEKWLAIESERFSEVVLRLFHTELEAVYEEFNRGQDSDLRQAYYKLMEMLFPNHPYGQQTTIGKGEHLKNPSMVKIHEYFAKRYVPNNMAIILAGDVNPDEAIRLIDKYFGHYEPKPLEEFSAPEESPITEPKLADVYGSEAEFVLIGYRFDGANSRDALFLELVNGILSNGTAGLIDLNLNQKQLVLNAASSVSVNEDYSWLTLRANNRQGQTLEETRELLLAQIDSLKQGKFEQWMIDAYVRQLKKQQMIQMERNWIRAYLISDAFILGLPWEEVIKKFDRMQSITKEQLVQWANEKFGNNYVAVHKRIGPRTAYKVPKPKITKIELNRDTTSAFFKQIQSIESSRLEPVFVDFDSAIKKSKISDGIDLHYVKNEMNEVFYLYYVFDMGSFNDPLIPVALKYLPYLGTPSMSPAEVQKELFRLGLNFDASPGNDRSYFILTGLEETFDESLEFFERLLQEVEPDQAFYDKLVDGIVKERNDKKLNKGEILFRGLANLAQYGEKNPFNTVIPEQELRSINPKTLTDLIHSLASYPHRLLYYGPRNESDAKETISTLAFVPDKPLEIKPATRFEQLPTEENKVYYTHYDMVQTEMMLFNRGPQFDIELMPESRIFNEYFGSGLSSIVFQEIRESRALAYSAWAGFTTPDKKQEHHYVRAYIGTQANKLGDATTALLQLMSDLPEAKLQFEQARISALKNIETNRVFGQNILWAYEKARDLGLGKDINELIYPQIKTMSFGDLKAFFDQQIRNKYFTYVVIGNKADMDMAALNKLGPTREVTLKEIFGY